MKSFFFILILVSLPAYATKITVVTEAFKPLQYLEENEVKGPATDLVKALLESSNFTYSLNLMPWARAYKMAKEQPNVLIYSMSRTKERENEFHWIGLITPVKYKLYGLKTREDLIINSIEDIKNYNVGVLRGSATESALKKLSNNLISLNSAEQIFSMTNLGRIDVFPANTLHFKDVCRNYNSISSCKDFTDLIEIPNAGQGLYIALSKSSTKEVIQKLTYFYQKLKDNTDLQVWRELQNIKELSN